MLLVGNVETQCVGILHLQTKYLIENLVYIKIFIILSTLFIVVEMVTNHRTAIVSSSQIATVSHFRLVRGRMVKIYFQSRKRLYIHKCLFVCPLVTETLQQLAIIIIHHSSFNLHHSSFILHHSTFISRLLSFSACCITVT